MVNFQVLTDCSTEVKKQVVVVYGLAKFRQINAIKQINALEPVQKQGEYRRYTVVNDKKTDPASCSSRQRKPSISSCSPISK